MNESNAMKKTAPEGDDWLSPLMDGELPEEAARSAAVRLGKDEAARQRWAEYALVGDALRHQAGATGPVMARFRAALAEEPTVLAPAPSKRAAAPRVLWLAAAATVAGITWTVLNAVPEAGLAVPVAMAPAGVVGPAAGEVAPYLAAHQDYAHAVIAPPEMQFTRVSLAEGGR
jgi:sigma-E factor negative regulatory protein RseA